MATFISLVNFTQQGIRDFKASPDRAAKFKSMAEKAGAKVKEVSTTRVSTICFSSITPGGSSTET